MSTFVCKVHNGEVEWVNVRKGEIMHGLVEVFGNIHEGDYVATQASEELVNHSHVRPIIAKTVTTVQETPIQSDAKAQERK